MFVSEREILINPLAALQEVSGRVVPWQSFNESTGEDVYSLSVLSTNPKGEIILVAVKSQVLPEKMAYRYIGFPAHYLP